MLVIKPLECEALRLVVRRGSPRLNGCLTVVRRRVPLRPKKIKHHSSAIEMRQPSKRKDKSLKDASLGNSSGFYSQRVPGRAARFARGIHISPCR